MCQTDLLPPPPQKKQQQQPVFVQETNPYADPEKLTQLSTRITALFFVHLCQHFQCQATETTAIA